MDWLLARQKRIEKKLAARHLSEGDLVFYDVSSSYHEGRKCPSAYYPVQAIKDYFSLDGVKEDSVSYTITINLQWEFSVNCLENFQLKSTQQLFWGKQTS